MENGIYLSFIGGQFVRNLHMGTTFYFKT